MYLYQSRFIFGPFFVSSSDLHLFIVVGFSPVVGIYCFCSKKKKKKKKKKKNLECGTRNFHTPSILGNGWCLPGCHSILKRLADKYSSRKSSSYAQTLNWIRCRLSFVLLRSGILCLRGARTVRPANSASELRQPDLAMVEARLE